MTTDLEVRPDEQAEFEAALERARAEQPDEPDERYVDGKLVVWTPQPGSQVRFLSCPLFEALYHGNRGGGKTDALIMDYAQHVGQGFGSDWRGVLFRQTYPQLADVVAKSERWFRQIFPRATFNRQRMAWEFETGETLLFRHMARAEDYWNYHGHELPWQGWEELTNWSDDRCYKRMFSCCRSPNPRVPRKVRATTNPYGVGHDWIKRRWRLHGPYWQTIVVDDDRDERGNLQPARCAIPSRLAENLVLLEADPGYRDRTLAGATSQAELEAWDEGSWRIVAGGMFADVWSDEHNLVPPFEIPDTWPITRSFDWGSSRPFSVGWWAESDGSDLLFSDGRMISTVRGDLFRVREWYGSTGRPNEGVRMLATDIARGIVEREIAWRFSRVRGGVADSSIFKVENGNCIATDMAQPVRIGQKVYPGVTWQPSDKSPGSRRNGWELMRSRISEGQPREGRPRERPGLFVVGEHCEHWIRTVLSLPRSERDMDDVDTNAEDHAADETRYRIRQTGSGSVGGDAIGAW